jgi:hypothetical protein
MSTVVMPTITGLSVALGATVAVLVATTTLVAVGVALGAKVVVATTARAAVGEGLAPDCVDVLRPLMIPPTTKIATSPMIPCFRGLWAFHHAFNEPPDL